jgi:hypothetical protein
MSQSDLEIELNRELRPVSQAEVLFSTFKLLQRLLSKSRKIIEHNSMNGIARGRTNQCLMEIQSRALVQQELSFELHRKYVMTNNPVEQVIVISQAIYRLQPALEYRVNILKLATLILKIGPDQFFRWSN